MDRMCLLCVKIEAYSLYYRDLGGLDAYSGGFYNNGEGTIT
mgnify:CR=1 FL=1